TLHDRLRDAVLQLAAVVLLAPFVALHDLGHHLVEALASGEAAPALVAFAAASDLRAVAGLARVDHAVAGAAAERAPHQRHSQAVRGSGLTVRPPTALGAARLPALGIQGMAGAERAHLLAQRGQRGGILRALEGVRDPAADLAHLGLAHAA